MNDAFAWLGQIFEWLGRWVPRWIILDTTSGAVKYVHGSHPVYCAPGIHWYWPVVSVWVEYPIVRQTDRLESQAIESVDGKTFLVSGTLTYEIEDLLLLLPRTHSPSIAIVDIAMTAVHDVCCDLEWDALQLEQRKGTLKTKLKNAAQKQLAEYGVKVIKFQLNTLTRCRVLRLSQSTSSEEN